MASDWRIVEEPLGKRACRGCGVAEHAGRTTAALFDASYELYAHPPGVAGERGRQSAYAGWIAASIPGPPRRILDVGCGNGSLLLALAERWPDAELLGCDPSGDSVAHGRPPLRLWQGTSSDLPGGLGADLVVAVNVIEHTHDPESFVRDLLRAAAPGATVVVVCPDGATPGVELLFWDHLWSLARGHLARIVERAGIVPLTVSAAPAPLGEFQLLAGRAGDGRGIAVEALDVDSLNARRVEYLERWRRLDEGLLAKLPPDVVCFGAGEAAGLLRAYAPRSWSRVRACTADAPEAGSFGAVPLVPLPAVPADAAILVGVRPADQPRVAARLRSRFARVTTWYDLVGDDRS